MKQIIFLVLTLFVLSAASMSAQVTIGSTDDPHSGALLDLQSTTLGLKLPCISIISIQNLGLPLKGTFTAADAKGMVAYNTNPALGEGLYVWDGSSWKNLNSSRPGGEPEAAQKKETIPIRHSPVMNPVNADIIIPGIKQRPPAQMASVYQQLNCGCYSTTMRCMMDPRRYSVACE
jgi:hypothetical protein